DVRSAGLQNMAVEHSDVHVDLELDLAEELSEINLEAPEERSQELQPEPVPSTSTSTAARGRTFVGPLARMIGAASLDHARAKLVWLAWGMGVTALLGLIDATSSAIRLSRGGAALTGTEIVMSTLGSLALLVMPTWLFGHYVSSRVWGSTPRVEETIRRLRRVLFAGLVTYAAGTLLIRVFSGVLASELSTLSSAGWGLLLVVIAAVAGLRTGWRELHRGGLQES
ncbi:MAG TPA: hypothetical protein VMF89_04360, partial [Polyangiales bacterium]|nr:hypothetical protein [Polyangiales bacterium]